MEKTTLTFCCCLLALWVSGQVHYTNVAGFSGIQHRYVGTLGGGISFVDFDNDGLDDLTIATGAGEPIHFYKNNGNGFTAIMPPVPDTGQAKQLLWVDFDNDGDYDLYVAHYGSANRLYENLGQLVFEDITEKAGLPINDYNTFGACFGDIDRDGWLDLYYHDRIPFMTSDNRHYLFKNNADGTFTDITEASQTTDGGKVPFCSAFIDYNNDRWPDIYTAHDKFNIANVLLENNGDGTFTDVSAASNSDLKMDAMCVAPGDYNNDGWIDIYITNTANGGSALLHNIGPGGGGQVRFGNSAVFAGVTFPQRTGWGAVFLDADNDQDLDLYVTAANYGDIAQSNTFYLNNGNNTFSEPGAGFSGDTTITYNTAIGDFNQDGFPDIAVINQTPFYTQLWRNNGGNNHWLKIKLQGVLSNRDAIGSRIEVFSGGRYQMRYTLCGNGFMGQNSLTEIIGLQANEQADSILITWPTGHMDRLYDVREGESIIVVEGSTTNGEILVDEDVELILPPTSTVSDHLNKPFSFFPNPATKSLFFTNQGGVVSQIYILNSQGWLMKSVPTPGISGEINIADYPPGIYFILSVDHQGKKYTEKWIKL